MDRRGWRIPHGSAGRADRFLPADARMAILLLAFALFASLLLVPLGLPGLWLMLAAGMLYDWLAPAGSIALWMLLLAAALAVLAEVLEFTLAARYAARYGGSPRAGWGAIIGGLVGAFVGIPVPVIGSVIGAFAGAFVGALAFELTRSESTRDSATRVAWGALLGRVMAAAAKTGLGCAIAAILLVGALRG